MTVSGLPSSWLTRAVEIGGTLFVSLAFSQGVWPGISRNCKKICHITSICVNSFRALHPVWIFIRLRSKLTWGLRSFSKSNSTSPAIIHSANIMGFGRKLPALSFSWSQRNVNNNFVDPGSVPGLGFGRKRGIATIFLNMHSVVQNWSYASFGRIHFNGADAHVYTTLCICRKK